MKRFQSFREWRVCVRGAARHLLAGIVGIARAVFVGLGSLLLALWRFLSRQVGRYPSVALGAFLVAIFLVWMLTFVSMRARAVGAECERDSLSWLYLSFKQNHGYE